MFFNLHPKPAATVESKRRLPVVGEVLTLEFGLSLYCTLRDTNFAHGDDHRVDMRWLDLVPQSDLVALHFARDHICAKVPLLDLDELGVLAHTLGDPLKVRNAGGRVPASARSFARQRPGIRCCALRSQRRYVAPRAQKKKKEKKKTHR